MAKLKSGAFRGVDACLAEVEVDLYPGQSKFITVGLPEVAVRESQDRVRAALRNSGYQFPRRRSTIILS